MMRMHDPYGLGLDYRYVLREPVSTAIGLTALISSLGVSGAVAGAIGGGIISGAISIGLSYAAQALLPKPGQSAPLNTPEIRYSTRQSTPAKRFIYGDQVHCGGALSFEKVVSGWLVQQFLVCDAEIEAVEAIYIGANKLSFATAITPGTILSPIKVDGQPDYANNLKVCVRLGTDDQTRDPLLNYFFPNLESSFRQRGIATVTIAYKYGANADQFQALWGQVRQPAAFFLVRGVRIYDPRKTGQSATDASTWSFANNNNASLVQVDFLRRLFGGRIDANRIDWEKVAEAADWDDGLIAVKTDTGANELIKRHTIDGLITLDQSPAEIMQGMLSANRGYVLQAGGKIWVNSSLPRDPVLTIADTCLVSGIEWRDSRPKRENLNSAQTRFVSSEREYQLVDGPLLAPAELEAEDGEPLPGTLSLPFTLDHRRVQRLQKAFLYSSRLGKTIALTIDLKTFAKAKKELIGEPIRVQSELFPQANGIYQVVSLGFSAGFASIEIAATEYDKSIETDFNAAVDQQAFEEPELTVS